MSKFGPVISYCLKEIGIDNFDEFIATLSKNMDVVTELMYIDEFSEKSKLSIQIHIANLAANMMYVAQNKKSNPEYSYKPLG